MLLILQSLWRPITGVVMSLIVLVIALGWLPPSAEEHASSILNTAGVVLTALTTSRAVQKFQEAKSTPSPEAVAAAVADEVTRRLSELLPSSK